MFVTLIPVTVPVRMGCCQLAFTKDWAARLYISSGWVSMQGAKQAGNVGHRVAIYPAMDVTVCDTQLLQLDVGDICGT